MPTESMWARCAPALSRLAGAGPAQYVLHQPLKLHELLAADLSKGEFYDDEIDWQATMFQPVGGMDRIPYGFARALPASMIHYECPVTEITTGDKNVTVAYSKGGMPQTITADFCICTMPLSVLATTKNNFSPEANAGVHRHADGGSLQDRLGIAPILGERESHLWRYFFPQEHGRPGLVPQRKTVFSYGCADCRLQYRTQLRPDSAKPSVIVRAS